MLLLLQMTITMKMDMQVPEVVTVEVQSGNDVEIL